MIKDSIGQELNVGDEVAYVHKCGSSVDIDRRIITETNLEDEYIKLDGKNARPVMPYNVVRLETRRMASIASLIDRAAGDRSYDGNLIDDLRDIIDGRTKAELFNDDVRVEYDNEGPMGEYWTIYRGTKELGIVWWDEDSQWQAEAARTGMSWGLIDSKEQAIELLEDEE